MGRLIVFSGAGLSAESGLATFRGSDGLWNGYRIEDVCYFPSWRRNFHQVHDFYNQRRVELGRAEPNAAHRQIAEWQRRYLTVLLTQNVDDLLERAGCQDVVHLHGVLREMHCTACDHVWDIGYSAFAPAETPCPAPGCGTREGVKPNIRFFGEICPLYETLQDTIEDLTPQDVVVVMGTSLQVIPMHHFLTGRPSFNILANLDPAEDPHGLDPFDVSLIGPATRTVREIDTILRDRLG
ncbi:MAG TPA: Sir2 family NAD-dependent protein deacetylase [Acetobacteraceae bacterium]|nr:Sir2 family NAD-dependent protein deacetylase [Acetobacteraceae bacterium]